MNPICNIFNLSNTYIYSQTWGGLLVQNLATATNNNYSSTFRYATTKYSWTVPEGVYVISIIAIGGGGEGEGDNSTSSGAGGGGGALAYKNSIVVTPGEILDIYVGSSQNKSTNSLAGNTGASNYVVRVSNGEILVLAAGGVGGGVTSAGIGGAGGSAANCIGEVAFSGSSGFNNNATNGGNGGATAGYAGDGNTGGSSGAGASIPNNSGHGGGGVGVYGIGLSGTINTLEGGSGGSDGTSGVANGSAGGSYGGGGGGGNDYVNGSPSNTYYDGGLGRAGAVRIVWGPDIRQFPDINVADSTNYGSSETVININTA